MHHNKYLSTFACRGPSPCLIRTLHVALQPVCRSGPCSVAKTRENRLSLPLSLSVLFSESSFPFIIITCFTLTPGAREGGSRCTLYVSHSLFPPHRQLQTLPRSQTSSIESPPRRCPAHYHQRVLRRLLIIGAVSGSLDIQCYMNYLDKIVCFRS